MRLVPRLGLDLVLVLGIDLERLIFLLGSGGGACSTGSAAISAGVSARTRSSRKAGGISESSLLMVTRKPQRASAWTSASRFWLRM